MVMTREGEAIAITSNVLM